jgi:hypothetical protein
VVPDHVALVELIGGRIQERERQRPSLRRALGGRARHHAPDQQRQDSEGQHVPGFSDQEIQELVRREPQVRLAPERSPNVV